MRLLHRRDWPSLLLLHSGDLLLARLRVQLEQVIHLGSIDLAHLLCRVKIPLGVSTLLRLPLVLVFLPIYLLNLVRRIVPSLLMRRHHLLPTLAVNKEVLVVQLLQLGLTRTVVD